MYLLLAVSNPLPLEITIDNMFVQAGINDTVYFQFEQTFQNFTVPQLATIDSGVITNVTRPQGEIPILNIMSLGYLDIINSTVGLR